MSPRPTISIEGAGPPGDLSPEPEIFAFSLEDRNKDGTVGLDEADLNGDSYITIQDYKLTWEVYCSRPNTFCAPLQFSVAESLDWAFKTTMKLARMGTTQNQIEALNQWVNAFKEDPIKATRALNNLKGYEKYTLVIAMQDHCAFTEDTTKIQILHDDLKVLLGEKEISTQALAFAFQHVGRLAQIKTEKISLTNGETTEITYRVGPLLVDHPDIVASAIEVIKELYALISPEKRVIKFDMKKGAGELTSIGSMDGEPAVKIAYATSQETASRAMYHELAHVLLAAMTDVPTTNKLYDPGYTGDDKLNRIFAYAKPYRATLLFKDSYYSDELHPDMGHPNDAVTEMFASSLVAFRLDPTKLLTYIEKPEKLLGPRVSLNDEALRIAHDVGILMWVYLRERVFKEKTFLPQGKADPYAHLTLDTELAKRVPSHIEPPIYQKSSTGKKDNFLGESADNIYKMN